MKSQKKEKTQKNLELNFIISEEDGKFIKRLKEVITTQKLLKN